MRPRRHLKLKIILAALLLLAFGVYVWELYLEWPRPLPASVYERR